MAFRNRIIFLVLLFLPLAALPAKAFVQVLGGGLAHDCFLAAKTGVEPVGGIKLCDAALRDGTLDSHDRAGTLVNRGMMKVAAGRLEEAMADYEAGIALMPDLGEAYVNRGVALIRLERYEAALTDLDKGIALGSSLPHLGYYDRALAEEHLGRYLDAYHDFKHVLELEPGFQPAAEELKYYKVVNTPG
jgi:tetratricopeptide (TPR) repeat protein